MTYKKGSKEAKAHMAKVRASKVSGVKKKVTKKPVARKKAVAKKKVNISYDNSWGKYLDSNKKAKPAGKRISAEGNVYYEYRRNRTDVNQRAKKGQMLGIGNLDLMDVMNELSNLEIKIISLKEQKKRAKLKSEQSEIQYNIGILNNQHKTLKLYLNSIARFVHKSEMRNKNF
jgi:hypothetical protein